MIARTTGRSVNGPSDSVSASGPDAWADPSALAASGLSRASVSGLAVSHQAPIARGDIGEWLRSEEKNPQITQISQIISFSWEESSQGWLRQLFGELHSPRASAPPVAPRAAAGRKCCSNQNQTEPDRAPIQPVERSNLRNLCNLWIPLLSPPSIESHQGLRAQRATRSTRANRNTVTLITPFIVKNAASRRLRSPGFTNWCSYTRIAAAASTPPKYQ